MRAAAGADRDFDMTDVLRAARAAAAGLFVFAFWFDGKADAAALEQAAIAPAGFINFEMRYPEEIRDTAPAFATGPQIEAARVINGIVNGNVIWRETRLWTIAPNGPSQGDCKTYALTKRHDLRQVGVPDGALRLAIVYTPHYKQLHMILELQTADGVYVLDSLKNDSDETFYKTTAMPTSYTVLKYEAWGRPEHWLAPAVLTSQYDAGGQDISY